MHVPALPAPAALARAVGCALEPRGVDRGIARYVLYVRNATAGVLAGTVRGIRHDGTLGAPPFAVAIEPGADVAVDVALPLAGGPYVRVVADLRGDDLHLVVDAPPPAGTVRTASPAPAAALAFGAALLAVAGALGALAARPHVDAARLAPQAGALVASWSTHGPGAVAYDLLDERGGVLAAGALPSAAGHFAVAPGLEPRALRIAVRGPFGSDARTATLVVPPASPPLVVRAPAEPHVTALAIDAAAPGAPIRVRYAVVADALHLTLAAPDGRPWADVDAAPGRGVATLPAAPGRGYAVVARAAIGSRRAEARVALPDPAPTAAPAPAPAAAVAAAVTTADGLVLRPGSVAPGEAFVVGLPPVDGAHVAIVRDRDGAELRALDVGAGQRVVALVAPDVAEPATLRVTLSRGASSELLVRPLRWPVKTP